MALFWIALLTSLLAQDQITCDSNSSRSNPNHVLNWINNFDRLGNQFIQSLQERNARQLEIGTIIDNNCLSFRGKTQNEVLDQFSRQLQRTVEQLRRCEEATGLPTSQMISVLRRSHLTCINLENNDMETYTWPSRFEHAHAHRNYSIAIDSNFLTRTLFDNSYGGYDFQYLLFHEATHYTANNHRCWHNQIKDRDHTCQNSKYLDRIYMYSFCFPNSNHGTNALTAIENCPGLCERAMSTIDEEFDRQNYTDPSLDAYLWTERQSAHFCQRLKNNNRRIKQLDEGLNLIMNRFERVKHLMIIPSTIFPLAGRLRTEMSLLLNIRNKIKSGENLASLIEQIETAHTNIQALFNESCPAEHSQLQELCVNRGEEFLSTMRMAKQLIEEINTRERSALFQNFTPLPELIKFYQHENI